MEGELDGENVVVKISNAGEKSGSDESYGGGSYSFSKYIRDHSDQPPPAMTDKELSLRSRKKNPTFVGSSTLEVPKMNEFECSTSSMTRRRSLVRSTTFKTKSRLVEPPIPSTWKTASSTGSPSKTTTTTPKSSRPITPRTPLLADEDVYYTEVLQDIRKGKRAKKVQVLFLIEFGLFVCIFLVFVLSLTVDELKKGEIWSLELWKWCVFVLVIFSGRLCSEWFTNVVVFLIERNFLLKKKVLYFVYSLQKSVRVFIWLGLILLAWGLLINRGVLGVRRTRRTTQVLNYITRGIASTLVGAGAWTLKTLFVKILASSFHVKIFFDRIQESIFHQYVLQTLSGPPLMMDDSGSVKSSMATRGRLCFRNPKEKGGEVIDVGKLQKVKREKVSAWTMRGLIKVVRKSGFSTLSDALDASEDVEEGDGQQGKTITCEWEAENAGSSIFANVAKHNPKYIEEEDLLRFMNQDEVDKVLTLFQGAVETGKIKKKTFCKWVVDVYKERKLLALSLNDTKTAIEELNKLVSGILLIVLLIVWLLLMGFASTQVLLFISSQLLLYTFMFGDSAKTAFESIIFVFVMHPFDVGDRCVVDGLQVVVEEMNILTTVFLKFDNEKIFYPNAVLATKAISNFNRSPEMSDSVDFDIDVSTSIDNIIALKAKIKAYIESKPQQWRPKHSVRVSEIQDVNRMKMSLYVTHTINFQNYDEKSDRHSDLVLEINKIFQELRIKYRLLPQEVVIRYATT